MPSTKLTLNVDAELLPLAKQLARDRGTSLSAMFERHIRVMLQQDQAPEPVGPLTTQALGLVKLADESADRELLEDALAGQDRS